MEKRSMRGVPAKAQDELRDRVIASLNAGMRQAEAARTFGVADRSIRRWVARMKAEGLARVVPRVRGRRAGQGAKLNAVQAEAMRRLLTTCMPDDLGLRYPLWTRVAVADLVEREHALQLAPTTVSNYLRAWGMKPPVHRGTQAAPDTPVGQWMQQQYPRVAAQAGRDKATIFWAGECAVRTGAAIRGDAVGPAGTPAAHPATRAPCRMMWAASNRGTLAFQVFTGRFEAATWLDFLDRLLRCARERKVVLIAPAHPVHQAAAVQAWLSAHAGRVVLHLLPTAVAPRTPMPARAHADAEPAAASMT